MDLGKLARIGWFDFDTAALGTIQSRMLSVNVLAELEEPVVDKNVSDAEFIRQLIGEITRRKVGEIDDTANKDEGAELSQEELKQIADDELERFAERFSQNHHEIFGLKGAKAKPKKDGKGVVVTPELKIEKKADETYCAYVRRGFDAYLKDQRARLASLPNLTKIGSMFHPFSKIQESIRLGSLDPLRRLGDVYKNLGGMGSAVENLRRNMELSDRLDRQISDARRLERAPVVHQPNLEMPKFRNPFDETNRRLDKVLHHVDKVAPMVISSAELIGNLNTTALSLLDKFVLEARSSRLSTIIAILLAALSFIVSIVSAWQSYSQAKQSADDSKLQTEQHTAQIKELIDAQDRKTKEILKTIQDMNEAKSDAAVAAFNRALREILTETDRRYAPALPLKAE